MISTVNNQKPAGTTAKQCDPGTPIMGRTGDTGQYQILKVNADGSLPGISIQDTQTPNTLIPQATSIPIPGLKAVGVCLLYEDITQISALTDGIYRMNPQVITNANPGGVINLALVKIGTTMDTYINTRNLGIDGFTPIINDFTTGFAMFWHNQPMQDIGGGNVGLAQLNASDRVVRLSAGTYKLFAWVHTAITTVSPTTFVGFSEFTKIV